MKFKSIRFWGYVLVLADISAGLFGESVILDRFGGNAYDDYRTFGTTRFLRLKLEFPGGQLDVNYSYMPSFATDSSWGAGFYHNFECEGCTFRDLTACTAVQIRIKGDGSLNTFHFELVETKADGSGGDGETWSSAHVSLSSTEWQNMIIPLTHFRRLTDSDSLPWANDYIEGDSIFVRKIARYNVILTGEAQTDTTVYFHLADFKAIDIPTETYAPPIIDDFELNSTIAYPVPFGSALPTIQYNWAIMQSTQTALQVYFNPQYAEASDLIGTGGFGATLPQSIDLSSSGSIQFDLKGDGTNNSLRLQLVQGAAAISRRVLESAPVALSDTSWRLVELPLACFTIAFDSLADRDAQTYLAGYNFVLAGSDVPDKTRDFIFIDGLRAAAESSSSESIKLPIIDSFEGNVGCALQKFGPGHLDWTTSPMAIAGNAALAVTYQFVPNDSIPNNWGAGLRRILPHAIDLRYYKTIEFHLHGNGSQNSMRLELVESVAAPADGETWASEFIGLDQPGWRRIALDLDQNLHLLRDRTDDLYSDYVDGNHIRNHQIREYRLVFTGQDSEPETHRVLVDNLIVSGRERPDGEIELVISEPSFSPLRGNVIFKYNLHNPAVVTIIIFRLTGELVAKVSSNSMQPSGEHVLPWDGTNSNGLALPNGLYLVQLKMNSGTGLEQDGLKHPKFIEIVK